MVIICNHTNTYVLIFVCLIGQGKMEILKSGNFDILCEWQPRPVIKYSAGNKSVLNLYFLN